MRLSNCSSSFLTMNKQKTSSRVKCVNQNICETLVSNIDELEKKVRLHHNKRTHSSTMFVYILWPFLVHRLQQFTSITENTLPICTKLYYIHFVVMLRSPNFPRYNMALNFHCLSLSLHILTSHEQMSSFITTFAWILCKWITVITFTVFFNIDISTIQCGNQKKIGLENSTNLTI